jgi:hypothetical protein
MHPKLIKANIALFKGARTETQRLLQEYIAENPGPGVAEADTAMVLWLDAQAQDELSERLSRLQRLVNSVDPHNSYARMARAYLTEEARYAQLLNPQRRSMTLRFIWPLMFLVIGGLITFGLLNLIGTSPEAVATPVDIQTQPTHLPDRSQILVADSFTARYTEGILQVTAIEDASERVFDTRAGQLATPVPGARFYALNLIFECRRGICNTPPEADLILRLDNGTLIPLRENAIIADQPVFQPIALGRTTRGWLVFEVPILSQIEALLITPASAPREAEPLLIELPSP